MSAITRCRRVNSWLSCKRSFRALPGRAGGAVVETTVDHTLCAGRNRMTVDASRSCLGLGTCVGSAIREIMDARVLLTATAPPAVPVRSVLDGSPAAPLDATTRFPRSACRHHMASDGPDEAGQFAGNHGGDDIGRLAGPREPAIARAQPDLPLPGDVADGPRLALLPQQQL